MKNTITDVAMMCHSVNQLWCELHGDKSQPVWEDAPDWQKQSAINGVTFHMNNPNAGDSASHESWMDEKIADGWVYGELKDPEEKTHPCIVPFNQLPKMQQIKDSLFRATVHAILGAEQPTTTVTDVSFNPSNNDQIRDIKVSSNTLAHVIGLLPPGRRRSVALTNLETASMWAVKAAAVGDA